MKNKGGRPTKYDKKKTIKKTRKYLKDWKNDKAVLFPSIVGLAIYLKVASSTVKLWMKEHKEFSAICDEISDMQHACLTHGGIRGTFNPTITKLMLTKHGYSDRQENINTNMEMTHEEALEKLK